MGLEPDLIETTERLARAFEEAAIEYAIGGAIAFAFCGEPRGTKDIDIALYVSTDDLERVFLTLQGVGAEVEPSACRWQLREWGHFDVIFNLIRVDVFLPDFPLYDWAYPRRRLLPLGSSKLWFWSAEDLVLFKLNFFRTKDKADIESILRNQQGNLDLTYIRRALREIFADEELTAWFETTVREILGPLPHGAG